MRRFGLPIRDVCFDMESSNEKVAYGETPNVQCLMLPEL